MTIRYLPSFYFEPLRMRFEYMNRIASRGGGGPVHRTEKTGSGPLRSRIVSYCSIGIYVPDARFSPSSAVSRQPRGTTPVFDPRRPPHHFRCEIVERTRIKLYRISDSPSDLAILQLSVIDEPWRAYRLLTCSRNYSNSTLLRVTVRMKSVMTSVKKKSISCENIFCAICLRFFFI